jgi:transcriptional regulator with XRE-family HTH domain
MNPTGAEIMLGLKDILSFLMNECDVDDATLSRETGIPASTISRMRLYSEANPTASTLRPIAKYFSISIGQLLGDEPLPRDRLPGTHNPTYFTSARMPVVDWDLIDDWVDNNGENIKEKLLNWISTEKEVGEKAFALIISTESFGLSFRKGSMIIVDPAQEPLDGDLILLKIEEEKGALLKQYLVDGSERYIRSVNPEMKGTKFLSGNYKILGVVIETRFSLQESKKTTAQVESSLSPVFYGSLLPNET